MQSHSRFERCDYVGRGTFQHHRELLEAFLKKKEESKCVSGLWMLLAGKEIEFGISDIYIVQVDLWQVGF